MNMWQTKRFDELKATGQLPSPTGVAMKILRMAQSEGVGPAEVAHVVEGDPALAGRILKLVNSAYYAGARTINAVSDAVARLGLSVVWQVALGFSVISNYRRGICRRFDYDQFWAHSLATAVAAQALGRHTRAAQPEEAFTCGLLGQIGRLALACIYPEAYATVLAATANQPYKDVLRLEQETFAMDHRELTAAMLHDWGVADVWVAAAEHHEDMLDSELCESDAPYRLALLLNAAAQLGRVCVAESMLRPALMEDLVRRGERLGVSREALLPICDLTAREWVNWGDVLGVRTRDLPSFVTFTGASHPAELPQRENPPEAPLDIPEIRVLIIDRDPATPELIRQYLPAGSSVVGADSSQEALRLALEHDPQLIVADWAIQGMSSVDFCRALRKTKAGQQFYILIMADARDENLVPSALEAGANEYVTKPILPRVLESRIRAALRVIRLQQDVVREQEEIRKHLAELAVLNRTLEQAALTDPLTDLPNRRYALDRLGQEWSASARSGTPLSCMIVDLDHFKRVNDTYGHDAGDQVLREVAAILRKCLRVTDVVCRIGGEEFLVICRDADTEQAQACAERLRRRVEAHRVPAGGQQISVTISIGIAGKTSSTPDVESLLKCADLATYASKTAGRNRVSLHEPASV